MQADKKGLSKREKRLILLLAVVVLFAVTAMYVIVPLFNKLEDRIDEYNTLSLEKTRIESIIATELSTRAALDTAAAEHDELMANYLSESLLSEIGRMLTGLCEEHRLSPIDQRLSAPKPLVTGDEGDSGATVNPGFLVVSATMTIRGSYDDLKSLLNTVDKTDYIRVSRVSFGRNNPETSGFDRITVYFEVIMLKDITED